MILLALCLVSSFALFSWGRLRHEYANVSISSDNVQWKLVSASTTTCQEAVQYATVHGAGSPTAEKDIDIPTVTGGACFNVGSFLDGAGHQKILAKVVVLEVKREQRLTFAAESGKLLWCFGF